MPPVHCSRSVRLVALVELRVDWQQLFHANVGQILWPRRAHGLCRKALEQIFLVEEGAGDVHDNGWLQRLAAVPTLCPSSMPLLCWIHLCTKTEIKP
jgi:hypothetical protein